MAKRTHWWIQKWLECRAIYLSIYLSICLSIYLSTYLSIHLSFYRFNLFATCLSICLAIYLDICLTQGPMSQRRSFLSPSSKSAPRLSVFNLTRFAWLLTWKYAASKWLQTAFGLRNVLRATTVRTFSISQLKAVRRWCVFDILPLKRAWHHNGLYNIFTKYIYIYIHILWTSQFPKVIKSAPNMVCFEPFDFKTRFAPQRHAIFDLSSDQMAPHPPLQRAYFSTSRSRENIWKTTFSDFSTFLCTCIFLLLALSLLWFCSSSFLFSDSFHLCFSICPYCPKFDF